ncbi:TPA: hypothetical protein RMT52_002929 [Escherichia coli]|uniref:hypothetical protein n=1 Tax=Escherichia coli TaxID=562 RepID=UPI000BE300AD|nr:hypothetical protein [Escherichia coli]EGO4195201.1 hypothetical protein [Escherichia coli]EKY5035127.1 hypothetical protein [Escherichia coli]HAX2330242.1 hypothetical protein [Escherichia coli]HDW3966872.1 hypothetical protein [Escherichia coli]
MTTDHIAIDNGKVIVRTDAILGVTGHKDEITIFLINNTEITIVEENKREAAGMIDFIQGELSRRKCKRICFTEM